MTTALYDRIGRDYSRTRKPDPGIAAAIDAALGAVRTVLNVGAGSGSYEPVNREVIAVEPSLVMIHQRAAELGGSVCAVAEYLPFPAGSFDACLATLTMHHWSDWRRGVREMRRVARERLVILTWAPEAPAFWLVRHYFPEFLNADQARFPTMSELIETIGGASAQVVPVPADCADGFLGAFWKRPTAYLDPSIRAGISAFDGVSDDDPRLRRLASDLEDGSWERLFGNLVDRSELDIGYRLVTATF